MSQPKHARGQTPKPATKTPRAPTGQKADSAARMEAFCLSYHRKPDGTQAAIDAGYAPKSATSTGSRLLTTDKVISRLRKPDRPARPTAP